MLDHGANRLGMSLTGSYPVKVSAIKDLETLFRDIIRLLSQAEKKKFHKKRKFFHFYNFISPFLSLFF